LRPTDETTFHDDDDGEEGVQEHSKGHAVNPRAVQEGRFFLKNQDFHGQLRGLRHATSVSHLNSFLYV